MKQKVFYTCLVYSVNQKNLVSFAVNIFVFLSLLSPTCTWFHQQSIEFPANYTIQHIFAKLWYWIKSVVYSRFFFSWKIHQDTEISFLCEILLLSLVVILVFACVYCCTNKWLSNLSVLCPQRGSLGEGAGQNPFPAAGHQPSVLG